MEEEKGSFLFYISSLIFIMFFATFGISDTAIAVAIYKNAKKVEDKLLPGTAVTEAVIPLGAMALAFLSTIEVDMVTLISCIVAASAGALIGVHFIVRFDEHRTRLGMGLALAVTALLIIMKLYFFGAVSGSSIGLDSWKLAIACLVFFITGALGMIGMSATIPNIAILLLLGIDIKAVFPIVMTCGVVGCGFGAVQFIRAGQYTRKAVLASVFGIIGVIGAVGLVHRMDAFILQVLMILLLFYCSFGMFKTEHDMKNKA